MSPKRNAWIGPIAWMAFVFVVIVGSYALTSALHPSKADGLTYTAARHMSQAAVQKVIRSEAKRAHLSKANTAALLWIARHESNFHATSSNHGRCLGVFQLSKAMCRGWNWYDPAHNTRRAIRYMKGRYGSPVRAEAFWKRHSWY
jgi:hypothetical protein